MEILDSSAKPGAALQVARARTFRPVVRVASGNRGRRDGLLLTLGLMAIGTVSIACTPSYASIGLIAPLLVVAGRLVQGLSAGV